MEKFIKEGLYIILGSQFNWHVFNFIFVSMIELIGEMQI